MKVKIKNTRAKLKKKSIDLAKKGGPEALHTALLKANPAVLGWNYDFAADVLMIEIPTPQATFNLTPFASFGESVEVVEDGA